MGRKAIVLARIVTVVLLIYSCYPAFSQPPKRVQIQLDERGLRGLVPFDHKVHEPVLNPDPSNPHRAATVACIGCHHTVRQVTDAKQFQKCSACHFTQGNPENPADKDGYELSATEIYHRSCIGCHIASKVNSSNERFTNVSFTKCGQCHDMTAQFMPVTRKVLLLPPAEEMPAPMAAHASPQTAFDRPLGFAGRSTVSKPIQNPDASYSIPDRWRIGFPRDPRYKEGSAWNPYGQNILKGDYPVFGQRTFLVLTMESDSFNNFRKLPVPSDVSSQHPDSAEFFGRGRQYFFRQNFLLSAELFHGDSAFKPVDWRIHVTPNFNINYLHTQENGIVNIDIRRGNTRTDGHIILQEAFGEARLFSTDPFYDTTSLRAGIQPLITDFRGFLFYDVNLGARLFGNFGNNRYQYNAVYFEMLEKDTNSDLNEFEFREQQVAVANLFRQDTFALGYTTQFSFHYNRDEPTLHFDKNNFIVRPAAVGDVAVHEIKAYYIGWTGDGHIGKINITNAFYQALGTDSRNPIAGRETDINAQMAALELSIDKDWQRYRGSIFWASGDPDPFDDTARGFDAILDSPEFAGGKFSFWNSQGIRLTQTGVALVNPDSLLPTLRSSKTEGQANFVNPGIFIFNAGYEADLTPKLKLILNSNYLRFHHTEPLEELLFQPNIGNNIGFDYGGGFIFRPLLNENAIIAAGVSALTPLDGLKDIYSSNCSGQGCGAKAKTLYSGFIRVKFTY